MEDTAGEEAVEQERAFQRRQPMGNEMPVPVAFRAVLAENEGLVVYACGLDVYSNGVGFSIEARARHGMDERLLESLNDGRSGRQLLLGAEYADGRRGSNLRWHSSLDEPAAVVLASSGRGSPSGTNPPTRCPDLRYPRGAGSPVSLRPHEPMPKDRSHDLT